MITSLQLLVSIYRVRCSSMRCDSIVLDVENANSLLTSLPNHYYKQIEQLAASMKSAYVYREQHLPNKPPRT
jgi:hypothetical protein